MPGSSEEAAFLRGEVGVDGAPVEEARDEAEIQKTKALESLERNRTWLGREWLTWLLWRSNSTAPLTTFDGLDLHVIFVGPVVLQGLAGEATELRAKGYQSAYAEVVREALTRGLLVHRATLRLMLDEQVYEVTVEAEQSVLRSARLPQVLSEDDDEALAERLMLVDRLGSLVDALWEAFADVREDAVWHRREVPGLRAWMTGAE
ncbi:MAG: hypothetical protein AAFZ18_01605 [Myxococcota bacterium]